MCLRKIIGKGVFKIVPITPGGCMCPQVKQIRDVDINPEITTKCRDIRTNFTMHNNRVTFRFCKCPSTAGCENLPPSVESNPQFLGPHIGERECWSENTNGLYFEGLYENQK